MKLSKKINDYLKKYKQSLVFKEFGAELTFAPDMAIPKAWLIPENEHLWEYFLDEMCGAFESYHKIKHPWADNIYADPGVVEIPSDVETDFNLFMRMYVSIVEKMKYNGFIPSSVYYLYSEGQCHQNFGMNEALKVLGVDKFRIFQKNLLYYIQQNPALSWIFLGPYDNHNAIIRGVPDDHHSNALNESIDPMGFRFLNFKDIQYNPEYGGSDTARVELRFFMMPRTPEEMCCHYFFAVNLLDYIFKITQEGKVLEFRSDHPYDKYTYETAVKSLKKICGEISFDFSDIQKVGKLKILKERLDLGSDYMN